MTGEGRPARPGRLTGDPDPDRLAKRAARPVAARGGIAPTSWPRDGALDARVCGLEPRAGGEARDRCRDIVPELILELV